MFTYQYFEFECTGYGHGVAGRFLQRQTGDVASAPPVPARAPSQLFRKLWGGLPTCGGVVYPACPGTWQNPGCGERIPVIPASFRKNGTYGLDCG